jgi:mannose-6-phosphate isomerase-like protein (cupin superfamily)
MKEATEDRQWGADPFFFTEAARGGPWIWRVGDVGFEGEPLGPVRHAHDDAAEYYYMYRGAGVVEAGGEELVLEEGQLGYIPPDAPHNFLGPASDRDAYFFCMIGPNFADNKWRVKNFRSGSEALRMTVGTPFVDGELPGGGTLSAQALVLAGGEPAIEVEPSGFEVAYLVIEGVLGIKLFGGLHGTIEAGTYVHVREGMHHQLSTPSGCKVLRMDCAFVPWEGVPLAKDAE